MKFQPNRTLVAVRTMALEQLIEGKQAAGTLRKGTLYALIDNADQHGTL